VGVENLLQQYVVDAWACIEAKAKIKKLDQEPSKRRLRGRIVYFQGCLRAVAIGGQCWGKNIQSWAGPWHSTLFFN